MRPASVTQTKSQKKIGTLGNVARIFWERFSGAHLYSEGVVKQEHFCLCLIYIYYMITARRLQVTLGMHVSVNRQRIGLMAKDDPLCAILNVMRYLALLIEYL